MDNFEDLIIIEEPESSLKSVPQVFEDIKDLVNCAYATAYKYIACGVISVFFLFQVEVMSENIIVDQTEEIVDIDFPESETIGSINLAYKSKARVRIEEELKTLSNLNDGWDSEAALKPTSIALSNTSYLIAQFDDVVLDNFAVFPSNDGGVYIQGKFPKGRITIFLQDSHMSFLLKGNGEKLSGSVKFNQENVDYLCQGLNLYV